MAKLLPEEFKPLAQYIHTISGIFLDDSKAYLIESRLSSLVDEAGCRSFSELHLKARSDASGIMARKIIDAITTGETSFFRDSSPFDLLRHKILPDIIDRRAKRGGPSSLRIWSAACSSGQEVYSIAIVLKEVLVDTDRYNVRLIGTDISNQAVANASRGIYKQIEIERGLADDKLMRYFIRQNDSWKIRDEIRGMATFRTQNLMEDFRQLGKFDIVFCRNVAIYFNEQTRKDLFNRIAGIMEPDGYLIIGSTESITGISTSFESFRYLRSVYYQLKS